MQLECLLDLLENKEYIKISIKDRNYRERDKIKLPKKIRIDAKNNLNKENFSKIKQLIKETNEVITIIDNWDKSIIFVTKKDLEKFIQELENLNEEEIWLGFHNYLEKEEQKWINQNTHFKMIEDDKLINKKIKKMRLETEKEKNNEAEQLLNALLK